MQFERRIKKDPEPKPGVSSPDGYSGGKGGAARRYAQTTRATGFGSRLMAAVPDKFYARPDRVSAGSSIPPLRL